MTPPSLAADLLYEIQINEDVENMVVADLGVGTGMLICGLIYIGSGYSIGFEIDEKYINLTREMLE